MKKLSGWRRWAVLIGGGFTACMLFDFWPHGFAAIVGVMYVHYYIINE